MQSPECFYLAKLKLHPINNNPHPISPLLSPQQPPFYFLSMNLIVVGTSYKWTLTVLVLLLRLAISLNVHVVACAESYSSFRLNNIALYI